MGSTVPNNRPAHYRKGKQLGAFSARGGRALSLDKRTRQARFYTATADALREHVTENCGEVTIPQQMLIEATAMVWTKFSMLGAKMIENEEYGSGSAPEWLTMMSGIRQNLIQLGIRRESVTKVLPSPAEILQKRAVNE